MGLLSLLVAGVLGAGSGPHSAKITVAPLPTVGLAGAEPFSPPPEMVTRSWEALQEALPRSRLSREWHFGDDVVTAEEAGQVLARMPKRPLPTDLQLLLDKASKAEAKFDYPHQIKLLVAAIRQISIRLEEVGDVDALIAARTDLAAAYLASGERAFAEVELGQVVRMRPDKELDLRKFAPDVIEVFNQVKLRALAGTTADVSIDVSPKGAMIILNGFVVGQSPKVLRVYNGAHMVQILAPGYETLSRVVKVTGAESPQISERMARDHTHQLADSLLASLRAADGGGGLQPARDLAETVGADAALLSGLIEAGDGLAMTVTLATSPPRHVVATFDRGFIEAVTTLVAALDRLADGSGGGELGVVGAVAMRAGVNQLGIDFRSDVLGRPGAPPRVITANLGSMMGATTPGTCDQDDPPAYCSPWAWLTAGGLVAVVAAVVTVVVVSGADPAEVDRGVSIHIQGPPANIGSTP